MWTPFDDNMMKLALAEAKMAFEKNEVPVGAVVVCGDQVVALAHNQKEERRDSQAHAEMLALAFASKQFGRWRLTDCTLYVSLEPCLMCAGAIVHARLQRVVFATRDPKFGAVKSLFETLEDPRLNHQCQISEGLLAEQSRELLRRFFQMRRKETKC